MIRLLPILPILLLLASSAPATASEVDRAEYIRLAGEIRGLADRQAWGGVERAYQAAVQTAHPLTFRDHLSGAHAASASGDMAAVRERLFQAHQIAEDHEVIDWLWSIDSEYGAVDLVADAGFALTATELAFDPIRSRSVTFAAKTLAETGTYQGLLPAGAYQVGDMVFFVTPGTEAARVSADQTKRRRRSG